MCSYPKPENIYFNSEMNPNLNIIIHYALTVKYLPQFRIILIETTQLPRSYFIVFYNNKVQMAHFP
jgi:hypothetical protein